MGKTSVQLLIFDLDGTLIESKWDIAKSVNLTLAELGLPAVLKTRYKVDDVAAIQSGNFIRLLHTALP